MRKFALVCAALALGACAPWTVRPLVEDKADGKPQASSASLWQKVAPAIESTAVDAKTANSANFAVKGQGKVVTVDRQSRHSVLTLEIAPGKTLTIQIGPVIRGTALRDVTGLIRFNDFVNQLQFADAANALNDRSVAEIGSKFSAEPGVMVRFVGAFSADEPGIVPVRLEVLP